MSRPRPPDVRAMVRRAMRPPPEVSARAWDGLMARLDAEAEDPPLPEAPPLEPAPEGPRFAWGALALVAAAALLWVWAEAPWRASASPRAGGPSQAVDRAIDPPPARTVRPRPTPATPTTPATPAENDDGGATGIATPSPSATPPAHHRRSDTDASPRSPDTGGDRSTSTFDAELLLVQRAREALDRGQAGHALELLEHHRRRYPEGMLVPERLATEVTALCRLHRDDQARTRAERFRAAYPSSSVARSLATAPCRSEGRR